MTPGRSGVLVAVAELMGHPSVRCRDEHVTAHVHVGE